MRFVALLATAAASLLRFRQDVNRWRLERELELDCPGHGLQREAEMVRLPSGSRYGGWGANKEIAAIIGPKKAERTGRVTKLLMERLSGYGIMVKRFTINERRAPPSVSEAINQKNLMQRPALMGQNELQKNQFQAQGDSIKPAGHATAILAEAEARPRPTGCRARVSRPHWCRPK